MLTRRHFKILAQCLRELREPGRGMDEAHWYRAYNAMVGMCKESNPLFDEDKFAEACGLEVLDGD